MELIFDGSQVAKPRAIFVLEKNTQLLVYKWLKSLRFFDRHASNISRLVNMEECKLYGMKNHDCHMFMQTLIPLAYCDLLPKKTWMHSWRSAISLEIYAPASWMLITLRCFKQISSR
jgi:hypothetical protein